METAIAGLSEEGVTISLLNQREVWKRKTYIRKWTDTSEKKNRFYKGGQGKTILLIQGNYAKILNKKCYCTKILPMGNC